MSARVITSVQAVASPPPGVVTDSGQAFIVGQTVKGPVGVPTRVLGLADFRAQFGDRTGAEDVFDAVSTAFKEGLGSAWILRAGGPSAASATVTLGTAELVVTAVSPGAWANGLTVAWDDSEDTLTVDGVDYVGTSVALLNAALVSGGAPVRVTGALPAADDSDVLASGTDDYASAVVADTLDLLDADLGDGAVMWPGKGDAVAEAIDAHCAAAGRLGLVCMSDADASQAEVIVEAGTFSALENTVLVWPYVEVDSSSGTQVIEPLGFAAGVRGRAHAASPAQSPVQDLYGRAKYVTGVVEDTSAAEWAILNAANVSVIRTSNSTLRLYGWRTCAAPDGVVNLQPAQFRDTINRVAAGCSQIAEGFVGRRIDGKGQALSDFSGQLVGFLSGMSGAFYAGSDDPGYSVDAGPGVNTTEALAAGNVTALVGVRLAPSAEFTYIGITATDAAGAL